MPNWVSNTVHVHADTKEQLDRFIRKTTKPHPEVEDLAYYDSEASLVAVLKDSAEEFSFWNILRPKKKLWKEYFSTSGSGGATPENNWYSWNTTHWQTKWDACNPEVERGDDTYATITFDTAWSPPMGIVDALGKKFPELSFTWAWEEEQGFGGEWEIKGDDVEETESYDIPKSHADFEERGRTCMCDWLDEEEDWYADCPRKEEEPLIKIAPDQPTEQENK
jgi:hypothetical protein